MKHTRDSLLRPTALLTTLTLALAGPAALADGSFKPKIDAGAALDGAASLQAVDLDGDGDLDLAVAEELGDRVSILMQTAPSSFATPVSAGVAIDGATEIAAGDLDGDGDADLVVSALDGAEVLWLENLGAGASWAARSLAQGVASPRGLELVDLDLDGDLEVLAAAGGAGELLRFDNLGAGTFAPAVVVTTTVLQVAEVTSADVDGDGFPDIIAGSGSNGQLFVLASDGLGGHGAAVQFGVLSSVHDLGCFDLDGDGLLDVLGTGKNANMLAWFRGDGLGDFENRVTIGTHVLPFGMDAADLDLDGDLDVFTTSSLSNQIAWHENLGEGSFGPKQVIDASASGSRDVLVVDLDADGVPDVVGANYAGDEVAIYLGTGDTIAPSLDPMEGLHCVESGSVSVLGGFLGGATVTLDGEPVVLTTDSEDELRFDLEPSIPGGLSELQVTTTGGTGSLSLARYPALDGPSLAQLGTTVKLDIHNGDSGIFFLAMSGALYGTPAPFAADGWYHGLELNGVWILAAGTALPGSLPTQVELEAPTTPALAGVTLYLQALTTQDGLGYAGFTATHSLELQ